jgi:hypothetical protein
VRAVLTDQAHFVVIAGGDEHVAAPREGEIVDRGHTGRVDLDRPGVATGGDGIRRTVPLSRSVTHTAPRWSFRPFAPAKVAGRNAALVAQTMAVPPRDVISRTATSSRVAR